MCVCGSERRFAEPCPLFTAFSDQFAVTSVGVRLPLSRSGGGLSPPPSPGPI